MGKFVLHNTRLFAGGADLTSNSNKVELKSEVDEQDATAFNPVAGQPAWTELLAGLATTELSGEGQWEAGDLSKVDDEVWTGANGGLGSAVTAWTVCPQSAAVGEVAWLTRALKTSYQIGGQVGDVAPWTAEASGTWPLARGVILHPPGTARTATGTGTAVQHVAVPSGGFLAASLHVLSATGTTPSITVKVQSDDAVGFPSPTDQITFTAATARIGEVKRLAGPITDTYYRVSWTISGTTPSFLFVVSLGVSA